MTVAFDNTDSLVPPKIGYFRTIEQGSKTLICIPFTKLNIHLLLERVFLNFSGYSLTVTQIQANATKRLHQFRNRSHFLRDAKRIYEKTYYSHASSVVSTVTLRPSYLQKSLKGLCRWTVDTMVLAPCELFWNKISLVIESVVSSRMPQ
ncbi:hypothetical protein CSKR_105827 [Clonorchis sinensis]|uniref:Uncharacterized protein n=1 Tax=Clonorchis sinensis TaxID=79923 RepID=A0A3R7C8I8_CLOSI|nr:hypothetical protein CSKR_105827 [Clonorchis sinensis]